MAEQAVIFLDIDGVVVTDASLSAGGAKCADVRCVSNLNVLVEVSGADVVVSSSWRMQHSLEFIRQTLCEAGFRWPERLIGATGHMQYRVDAGVVVGRAERSDEIRAWLAQNPCDRFVVLDDDFDAEIPGHFVRTCARLGLSEDHVANALGILCARPSTTG